jgi:hypothetical protein
VVALLLLHQRQDPKSLLVVQGPVQCPQTNAPAAAAAAASTGRSSVLVLLPLTGAPSMSLVGWQQWRLLLLL